MKVIAAICADFIRSPLGTRSRLEQEIAGETVIRRTLKRALAAGRIDGVFLMVDVSQESQGRRAADGLEVRVETHHAGDVPWQSYVASARKWSLDAWRGGIGGACVFDESIHPWLLEALCKREQADGVADVPAAAPLFDPAMLDRMVEHYEEVLTDVRMTFTQSAPGLSAAFYSPAFLADLAAAGHPPGQAMVYRPSLPQRDMIMLPCFFSPDADVRRAFGRCVADTDSAVERVTGLLREGGEAADALSVSRLLLKHRTGQDGRLPIEVEVELTTDDPMVSTTLRPRGAALGRRGCMAEDLFRRLVNEITCRDDRRLVLGGFGDPLLHPEWPRLVRYAREAGVFAIAVRTPAVSMDQAAMDAIIDAKVDVVNVLLDAASSETYRQLHGADHYERVIGNIDNLLAAARARHQPQPLVVCEMTKTAATMDEMEQFYDHWIGKTGSAVIVGPSTYGGQWPDRAVMSMAPPKRTSCERIVTRSMVLADGRVVLCDQDFQGRHAAGSLAHSSLSEIWTGSAMVLVRQAQLADRWDANPLCAACQEWHRP